MKKNTLAALLVFLFLFSVFISGCTINNDSIVIDEETTIPDCSERGLNDKIIMLEAEICSACKLAKPKLQALEEELDVTITYLDISKAEDREILEEYKVMPRYTPTVIVDCEVLIGNKAKEEYKEAILKNEG